MLVEALSDIRVWAVLGILLSVCLFRFRRRPTFPIINQYPGDLFFQKAHHEYRTNADSLIAKGFAKHRGPFTLAIPSNQKIVLPSSLTAWVKSNKDLDHRELVRQDFYAGFPGFEGQDALHACGDVILDVIRTKLGQNDSIMPVVNASLAKAFQIHWSEDKDWHVIDWHKDTTGIIARAASSIFVGPEKCDDSEWLHISQQYVGAYFTAVNELHPYPAWLKPIVQRFLPNAIACRKYVAQARVIMKEVIDKREKEVEQAKIAGVPPPEYNDVLAWIQAASGPKPDAGDIQLSLAMAAFFTTSELFRQVLVDIASYPEILGPLKKEVLEQISTHGISVAATNNMVLLDSVLKESQRRSAPSGTLLFSPLFSSPLSLSLIPNPNTHNPSGSRAYSSQRHDPPHRREATARFPHHGRLHRPLEPICIPQPGPIRRIPFPPQARIRRQFQPVCPIRPGL
jgi:hypothetical protein